MGSPNKNNGRDRVALLIARVLLWPIAKLRPSSGWAKIYQRLTEMHRSSEYAPEKRPKQPWSPTLTLFVVLVCAAAAVWIYHRVRGKNTSSSGNIYTVEV